MGEMINNSPLFPGENDIDQLAVVLQALGTPTLESWPVSVALLGHERLPARAPLEAATFRRC